MLPPTEGQTRPLADYVARFKYEERVLTDPTGTKVISAFKVPVEVENAGAVRSAWSTVRERYASKKKRHRDPHNFRLTHKRVYEFLPEKYQTGTALMHINDSRKVAQFQRRGQALLDVLDWEEWSLDDIKSLAAKERWNSDDLTALRKILADVETDIGGFRTELAKFRL